jgi:hypothetical protein
MAQYNEYRDSSDTNSGPSPAVWSAVNPNELETWVHYFEDYIRSLDTENGKEFTITQEASGAVSMASPTSTITGHGMLLVSSNGHNAAHDGINAQATSEIWCPVAGKKLIFEARVMLNDESDEFFVGLCDTETDIIEQTTGMLDTTARNMIGWYTDAGTTATYGEFVSAKAGSAEQQTNAGAGAVFSDNTWVKVGFIVEKSVKSGDLIVTPYHNGEAQTAITDTDDIPLTVGTGDMALSYVAQVAATGASANMYVDWVRIAQER